MYTIDNEHFGRFVASLRREHGLTQRQLAERLGVTDKAVSKWERGLSLPDIALLEPLAQALEVTISELLRGERLERALPLEEVEQLVTGSLTLTARERAARAARRRRWGLRLAAVCALAAAEIALLAVARLLEVETLEILLLAEGMPLAFGAWFCLAAHETLPPYYGQYPIGFYAQGPVRLHLPGIRLTNRNWPAILRAARWSLLAMPAVYPLLYGLAAWLLAPRLERGVWLWTWNAVTLIWVLAGIFLPIYLAARRSD